MEAAHPLVFRPAPALRVASAALLTMGAGLALAMPAGLLAWAATALAALGAWPLLRGLGGEDLLLVSPEGVQVRRSLFGIPLRRFTIGRAEAQEVGLRDGTGGLRLTAAGRARSLTVLGTPAERKSARAQLAQVLGLNDRRPEAPPVPKGWVLRAVGPQRLALERSPGHRLRAMLGLFAACAAVLCAYAVGRAGHAPALVEFGILGFALAVLVAAFDAGLTREVLVLSRGELRHQSKGLFRATEERIAPVLALRITVHQDSEGAQTCKLVVEGDGATATVLNNFVLPRQALPLARFLRWHVGAALALPDGVSESDLL